MVRARMYLICGNCGCNDEFSFQIDPKGHDFSDEEPKFEPAVFISCNNCSTIHDLSGNAEIEPTNTDVVAVEDRCSCPEIDSMVKTSETWQCEKCRKIVGEGDLT